MTHSGARVAIVERDDVTRAGLISLVAAMTNTRVVGNAATGREALALCRAERPDVVLIDLRLPDSQDTLLIERLRRASPRSVIVVLSPTADAQAVVDAVRAGANGYLLLGVGSDELARAVDRAVAGEAFIDPALAGLVVQALVAAGESPTGAPRPAPLTPREVEVLREIARGRSNKEIATDLHVAVGTAKVHVERILRKLTASNRTEATMQAVRMGLVDPAETKATEARTED